MAVSMSAKLSGIKNVEAFLSGAQKQIPFATMLALNKIGRDDVIPAERKKMRAVFDRPTPLVLRGLTLKKKATKASLEATVGFDDRFGRGGYAVESALAPHIPGFPRTRNRKGMERALFHARLITSNQYLVPSRTMKLNKYGNITGAIASKMLNDIGAFKNRSGFSSTTKAPKVRYVWATVGNVSGIWIGSKLRSGAPGALAMVVVNRAPTYKKRFDFDGVAQRAYDKSYKARFDAAIDQAIRTAR